MKCPNCQTKNPDTRKYCRKCGVNLSQVCPECGSENLPEDRYCGKCGHDLTLSPKTKTVLSFEEKLDKIQRYLPEGLSEKILAQREKIEGERRQVTVMFCDMEGFTPLSEILGPEKIYHILDEVFEILIHKVHDYDGTINKMTGDGIMALFGAPIALEDAPQRAVHAALSIHREMTRFSDRLKREREFPSLKMRIGIHTGPVVVGTLGNDLRLEFTAVGDTVNLASRMQGLAKPGTTYVTQETFRLTEGLFQFEALGETKVKGKKAPIKAYQVIAPSTVRTRFDVSVKHGLTPFVGRDRELELLLDSFEQARAGKGQALSIIGEAGVGKSRLLYEFRKAITNKDVAFSEGKCLSYTRGIPYHPIIDLLKSEFSISEGDEDHALRHKTRLRLKELGVDEADALPYLLELLSVKDSGIDQIYISPEFRKERMLEVLRRILLKSSKIQPLVIAIEDLHWMDKSSEEVLKFLMKSVSGSRILLVFTYRPEFVHTWGAKSFHNEVNLNRLSNRESLAMITYLLGTEEIEIELEELILGKTEGIPFFIEEFVKSIKDLRVIERRGGAYYLIETGDITIPSTIHDVIMARVDSLHNTARELLQIASVIEREFSYKLIKRVASIPERHLLSRLSMLKDSELVHESGIYPESSFIFKHALAREVVYDSIMTDRKKKLHVEIGNAIEDVYRGDLRAHASELVEHFSHSSDRAGLAKVVVYGDMAAQRALSVYAFKEAVQLLERAIKVQVAIDSEDKERQCDLLLALGEALMYVGESRRFLEVEAPVALSLAEVLCDDTRASRVCQLAISALAAQGAGHAFATPEANRWAQQSDRYARPGTVDRACADMCQGMVRSITGNTIEGTTFLTQALELALRIGDKETIWKVAPYWLVYVGAPQHELQRLRLAQELMGDLKAGVGIAGLGFGLWAVIHTFIANGQRQRAEEVWNELRLLTEHSGQVNYQLIVKSIDAVVATLGGYLEDAVMLSRQIQESGNELGIPEFAFVMSALSGVWPLLYLGMAEEALQLSLLPQLKAICLAHLGQQAQVMPMLEGLVIARPFAGSTQDETPTWADIPLLSAAVLVGHRDVADLLLRRFTDRSECTTGLLYMTCTYRHLGAANSLLGRPEQARSHYREALRVTSEMIYRPEIALTRLQIAELLIEHYPHERAEALEHLDFAIAEFRIMKMQPSLERALRYKENL